MTTLEELTASILAFRAERDWEQFHNPKDAAIALTLEAAEVLAHMQWDQGEALSAKLAMRRAEVGDELADVLYWVLLLSHDLGIDLAKAFKTKMAQNAAKYPVALAKGSSKKYTEL